MQYAPECFIDEFFDLIVQGKPAKNSPNYVFAALRLAKRWREKKCRVRLSGRSGRCLG